MDGFGFFFWFFWGVFFFCILLFVIFLFCFLISNIICGPKGRKGECFSVVDGKGFLHGTVALKRSWNFKIQSDKTKKEKKKRKENKTFLIN